MLSSWFNHQNVVDMWCMVRHTMTFPDGGFNDHIWSSCLPLYLKYFLLSFSDSCFTFWPILFFCEWCATHLERRKLYENERPSGSTTFQHSPVLASYIFQVIKIFSSICVCILAWFINKKSTSWSILADRLLVDGFTPSNVWNPDIRAFHLGDQHRIRI